MISVLEIIILIMVIKGIINVLLDGKKIEIVEFKEPDIILKQNNSYNQFKNNYTQIYEELILNDNYYEIKENLSDIYNLREGGIYINM
jgi:glutathionyl-hydroquinone reductase